METTCQICARPIKSKNGIIAHHGYKRPGNGWQTNSCPGARHLPYEVSCDILPSTIANIEQYIKLEETRLEEFINNPPEKIISRFNTREIIRPEGFNHNDKCFDIRCMTFGTYENEFRSIKYSIEENIKFSNMDLDFMKERLKNWIPQNK